jgi:hypothetical protein
MGYHSPWASGDLMEGVARNDHSLFSAPGGGWSEIEGWPDPIPGGTLVSYAYREVFDKYSVVGEEIVGQENGRSFSGSVNSFRAWEGDGMGGLVQTEFADFDDPEFVFEEDVTGELPEDTDEHYFVFSKYEKIEATYEEVEAPACASNPITSSGGGNETSNQIFLANGGIYHWVVRGPAAMIIHIDDSRIDSAEGSWSCVGVNLKHRAKIVDAYTDETVNSFAVSDGYSFEIGLPEPIPEVEPGVKRGIYNLMLSRRCINSCHRLDARLSE